MKTFPLENNKNTNFDLELRTETLKIKKIINDD
jgi:hypothetical protein